MPTPHLEVQVHNISIGVSSRYAKHTSWLTLYEAAALLLLQERYVDAGATSQIAGDMHDLVRDFVEISCFGFATAINYQQISRRALPQTYFSR